MRLKSLPKIIAFAFPSAILLANFYLFSTTEHKIEEYKNEPPFLRFDFTDSYLEDRSSQAFHLVDGKDSTEWKKLRPSSRAMDFDAELRLSHRLRNGIYSPSHWKEIIVRACSKKAPKLKFKIFLREAINVDKESRLPDDIIYVSQTLDFSKSEEIRFPLTKKFYPVPAKDYPKGIIIWSVEGTFQGMGPDACLKEIQILE
ncbi:hypothetical protein LEP1GSC050_3817 [Leptospira broomii serovar Hurstbridge str. 5399]|uniref:Uncharacterized protein n=1 Tax=Leptospira broomii serovar Hurstbridge str. 5399 TaxID=1049789 RepID=T0EZ89_9LEPT|nr:hypothetical protein LEP1GSC050_3817 [Leptospira broomii serovar Hurstbridge str. 5399]